MKKILWSCNVSPSNFHQIRASVFGGWLEQQYSALSDAGCDIYAIFPGSELVVGENFLQFKSKFLLGYSNRKKIYELLYKTVKKINPSLIHIHGAELLHSAVLRDIAIELDIPYVVSIQGIPSEYAKHIYTGLNVSEMGGSTFRDLILGSNVKGLRNKWIKVGADEVKTVMNASKIYGRTDWDKAWVELICRKSLAYEYMSEPLRQEFSASRKWIYDKCNPLTLFMTQGSTPVKGLHILLDALYIIKSIPEYQNIKLLISGKDFTAAGVIKKLTLTQYEKFIIQKINNLNLDGSVKFLNYLDAKEICRNLLDANLFIIPSLIENSPNSLMEALYLGVPSVASYVGGIPSFASDNKLVRFYQSDSALMCANAIINMLKRSSFDFSFADVDISNFVPEIFASRMLKSYDEAICSIPDNRVVSDE